jgi:predicted DNA-binding protein with PD1-like motif
MPSARKQYRCNLRSVALVSLALLCIAAGSSAADSASATAPGLAMEWRKPSELVPQGEAPHASWHLLNGEGAAPASASKHYLLVLRSGDELISALLRFAAAEKIGSATFTAIGGVRSPKFAWFDPSRKRYKVMLLDQPAEGFGIIGNLTTNKDNGRRVVHAHGAFGLSTGEVRGGHLVSVTASPTIEVSIEVSPLTLNRMLDPDTGIYLIEPPP